MNKKEIKEKLTICNEKESVILRGRLISYIRQEIKNTKEPKNKVLLRIELFEELNKHKEVLKNINKGETKELKISEKVANKIRGISNSINIFKEKYDVIEKLKKSTLGIATSSLVIGAFTAITTLLSGGALSIATLTSILPTLSYIGLSNLIKTPFTDTVWTRFTKNYANKDKTTDEIINFIDKNIRENNVLLDLLNKKSSIKDDYQLVNINEELVKEFDKIVDESENDEIRRIMTYEKINTMVDLKKNYNRIKKDYIKDRNQTSKEEYSKLNRKALALEVDIFKENSFIKDVGEQVLKNFGITTSSMYLSKMILSSFFPSLKMESMVDILSPLVFSLINNVGNIGSIKEKIRISHSAYNNQSIQFSDPELFEKLSKPNTLKIAG